MLSTFSSPKSQSPVRLGSSSKSSWLSLSFSFELRYPSLVY